MSAPSIATARESNSNLRITRIWNISFNAVNKSFGPYTLAEMQEYAQSGRILDTDLAKSRRPSGLGSRFADSGKTFPRRWRPPVAVAAPVETVPLPPNLHWGPSGVNPGFSPGYFSTCLSLLFNWAWGPLVLANWAPTAFRPTTRPLVSGGLCIRRDFWAGALAMGFCFRRTHNSGIIAIGGILIIAGLDWPTWWESSKIREGHGGSITTRGEKHRPHTQRRS